MQRFTVKEASQTQWIERLLTSHASVLLRVVDTAGKSHALVDVGSHRARFTSFEGEAERLVLELPEQNQWTSWSARICPTEDLCITVDQRDQLEVRSGGQTIGKLFGAEATPSDWPAGLIHASVGQVHAVYPLLRHTFAASLRSLDLADSKTLLDLSPLADLGCLTSLNLANCRCTDLRELKALSDLSALDLSGCSRLDTRSLQDLSVLTQLTELRLAGLGKLTDLGPLAALVHLSRLDLEGCKRLRDLKPLKSLQELKRLCLSSCDQLCDLKPIAGLDLLERLELSSCDELVNLEPIGHLQQLRAIDLSHCTQLKELAPIARLKGLRELVLAWCTGASEIAQWADLTEIRSLDLSGWDELQDLGPLSSMKRIGSLNLWGCTAFPNLKPLAGLNELKSLILGGCSQLEDLSPLGGLSRLEVLNLHECSGLAHISPIASLPALAEVGLSSCGNIRDIESLCSMPSLRELDFDEFSARDSVLLECSLHRDDPELSYRLQVAADSFRLSKTPIKHAQRLVDAVERLSAKNACQPSLASLVVCALRERGEVSAKIWTDLLFAVLRTGDPGFRQTFETALADLPLADEGRVLAPALLALAEAPATAKAWALDLAQRALLPVAASVTHAREVAPAAAVFFHSQGLATDVEAWLERGSVAQAPAWRDRVLVALLGRALRAGEILEARRLFALVKTPERQDEARGLLVQHLSSRSEFRDAAAELDAIVDRAVRASVAASALRQSPPWAAEPDAGLSLLLALDGDPDTLAEVLSSMIQQAPDSELVRHLAAVFAPTQGVDLAKQLDALLAHPSVAERVKPKQLAALRRRIGADASLAHRTLAQGTAALLQAEGLVDDDERAEITATILGQQA
jgi:Leucine-rich repeat (LRR) protein